MNRGASQLTFPSTSTFSALTYPTHQCTFKLTSKEAIPKGVCLPTSHAPRSHSIKWETAYKQFLRRGWAPMSAQTLGSRHRFVWNHRLGVKPPN